jgi:hypothetical protein
VRRLLAVISTVLMIGGLSGLVANTASAAPQLLEPGVPPGAVLDKADGPIRIGGFASFDTDSVLVAIRDNNTNRWWHPGSCGGGIDPADCGAGTFKTQWTRSPAVMSNSEDLRYYRFPADLPTGNYQLGLRPVAADGTVSAGGAWWPFEVINSGGLDVATATPGADDRVNEGLVTITSFHPFGSPIAADGPGTARIAIKRLNNNTWMQPDASFDSAYALMDFPISSFGPFQFVAQKKVDLAPGRYGYWIEHYSPEGVKSSAGWAAFNVVSCSNRCANVSTTTSLDASYSLNDDGGLCYSIRSSTFLDGGDVLISVKNRATGQWLQPGPGGRVDPNNPTFGSWRLVPASLGQIIQSDPNVGISCLFEDPIALPVGSYFMGINPVDTNGDRGPGEWLAFEITA